MTDPRIEAAVDAVIKARGWRDGCWGDGAIGGFDYSTVGKHRYVIRDHEAEAREGKTVILFETDDHAEYEREYRRACIRREVSAAITAADAAAWRHVKNTPPANEWVQVIAQHSGEDHYAIAQWCYDRSCWRNQDIDMMYSPVYFDHWRPLSVPPNTAAQHSPKAIAVPEASISVPDDRGRNEGSM